MRALVASASGLRHLRWAREILATLRAHHAHGTLSSPDARALLAAEIASLDTHLAALSRAVKAYRDFLERRRTSARGEARVGRYLGDEALIAALADLDAREREPLRREVRTQVAALRRTIDEMNARLATLPEPFVESLHPALTADASRVADVADDDDDASDVG